MKIFVIRFELDNGASINDKIAFVNAYDEERAIEFLEKRVCSCYDCSINEIKSVNILDDPKNYGNVLICSPN